MATARPRTAVLVLNYNGRKHLDDCLGSLGAMDVFAAGRPGRPVEDAPHDEVWLVDNGSSDGSVDHVRGRFPWVRILSFADNLGFPLAYDRAVEACAAQWVAFLNNDTRVAPDWLTQLHACRERHPEAAAVASRIMSWEGDRIDFVGADTFFFGHAWQQGVGEPAGTAAWPERRLLFGCAGSLLFRRDTFLAVGGFDPDYFSFIEDVDLGWRASVMGFPTWFAPAAVTHHRLHATWGDAITPRKRFLLERNALCNVYKNYDERRMGVVFLVSTALAFLRGWWAGLTHAELRPVITADTMCHLLALADLADRRDALRERRALEQAGRRCPDEELLPLFGALDDPPLPSFDTYHACFRQACALLGLDDSRAIASWDAPTNAAAEAAALELAGLCTTALTHRHTPESFLPRAGVLSTLHPVPMAVAQMLWDARTAIERFLAADVSAETLQTLRAGLRTARRTLVESTAGPILAARGGALVPRVAAVRPAASAGGPAPTPRDQAPAVTVVVRTQDRPAYLRRALASIAAQELRPAEVVVVNDGGADPAAVVNEFADALAIRLVQHPQPLGRSRAAQAGLLAATGDLVGLLDDDDEFHPAHLRTLVAGLRESKLGAAYADVECLVVEGEGADESVVSRGVFAAEFDPVRLRFENYLPMMAVLFDRRLALEAGGFDPELDYFEDWDLWLRLAQRTSFHHCAEITATYFVRPALGQGTATAGAHRWPHFARLTDKHRGLITGDAWAEYFRRYVEPTRERLRALEVRAGDQQEQLDTLSTRLHTIETSRSWRLLQRARRLLRRR